MDLVLEHEILHAERRSLLVDVPPQGVARMDHAVVKDDRPADVLVQCSDNTWNAYNEWPSKYSVYTHPKGNQGPWADVSFDRPYGRYAQFTSVVNASSVVTRNTVPLPKEPPEEAVPYKFPSPPMMSAAFGFAPLVLAKDASVVSTPLVVSRNTVP